ncbi:MAG: hypothetical protein RIK87_18115 [Fuerstiella sp.]
MNDEAVGAVIGYSIFDEDEECYEYNENACFMAATRESADAFRETCGLSPDAARIDAVTWDDLLQDFGSSAGEYAMEAAAFARFEELAQQHKLTFEAEAYDGDESLMVVRID